MTRRRTIVAATDAVEGGQSPAIEWIELPDSPMLRGGHLGWWSPIPAERAARLVEGAGTPASRDEIPHFLNVLRRLPARLLEPRAIPDAR
jgi:hypothetical protein